MWVLATLLFGVPVNLVTVSVDEFWSMLTAYSSLVASGEITGMTLKWSLSSGKKDNAMFRQRAGRT